MDLKSHDQTVIDLEELPTRQRIIHVTIQLIAREGMHGLTTRSIAEAANVNIAAINYYFGTKEKLIEESLQTALSHMFSDTADLFRSIDHDQALRNIMLYLLEGSVHYPGLIKAMLHKPINSNDYNTPAMQQIIQFFREIISNMEQSDGMEKDSMKMKMKVMQMIAAALMPALLPDLYRDILGEGFQTDPEIQQRYIDNFFK